MEGRFSAGCVRSSLQGRCQGCFILNLSRTRKQQGRRMPGFFAGIRFPSFLDNDFVRTVFQAPDSALATSELSLRLIADGNRALLGVRTDRGLAGERGRMREMTLHFLLDFLFKAEYAYDMGMPQWLARLDHSLSDLRLERLFLGRHKIFHFRVWYRDALAGYIRETLLDPRSLARPYIERKGLEAVVRGHLKGDRNYTVELHTLLTLELLHRLYLDESLASPVRHYEVASSTS
jgi:asparagine synthase (glutamine-hydrolysing)